MPTKVKGERRYLRAPLMVRGITTAVGGDSVESVDPVGNLATAAAPPADPADGPVGRADPWRVGKRHIAAEDGTALGADRGSVE